ncbi:MAG TPA: PEP-CTERM sorting domain-containing protein [Candidatus Acidoferrales bacterium]|nr:PEP-CTERM sorting domain-containing protein [Candidatus Acidoferrales bacterium]
MARGFTKIAMGLGALLLFTSGIAKASSINLQNGGTVQGSLVYDITTNSILSFDFTTTAGGGFGNESFIGSAPYTPASGYGAVVLTNNDQDQVFSIVAVQTDGSVDELDLVVACGGVANCVTTASATGTSYALAIGAPPAPCPNIPTTQGYCIESGLQNSVPGGLSADPATAGFLDVLDPTCNNGTTDECASVTLNAANLYPVFNPSGGGGGVSTPEPETLSMLALGLAIIGLGTWRRRSLVNLAS